MTASEDRIQLELLNEAIFKQMECFPIEQRAYSTGRPFKPYPLFKASLQPDLLYHIWVEFRKVSHKALWHRGKWFKYGCEPVCNTKKLTVFDMGVHSGESWMDENISLRMRIATRARGAMPFSVVLENRYLYQPTIFIAQQLGKGKKIENCSYPVSFTFPALRFIPVNKYYNIQFNRYRADFEAERIITFNKYEVIEDFRKFPSILLSPDVSDTTAKDIESVYFELPPTIQEINALNFQDEEFDDIEFEEFFANYKYEVDHLESIRYKTMWD